MFHTKALEIRLEKLAASADVIPPLLLNPRENPHDEQHRNTSNSRSKTPMLNPRETPQHEHYENTNNSRSKMPMLNPREPPQNEHYEYTNISRTTNTADCQEITSDVTDITSANENNASNIYIGNIYINFGQHSV